MATKMPAKRTATSWIGCHSKPLRSWRPRGVASHDSAATASMPSSAIAEGPRRSAVSDALARGVDQRDDGGEQREVAAPFEAERLALTRRLGRVARAGLAREEHSIPDREDDHEHPVHGQPLGPQAQRPREGHAFQEAEQQRWIAEGGQQAAAVRDHEDEEHHAVRLVLALCVGAQQGAHQEHRGAGRADHAREHGADREQERVREGSPAESSRGSARLPRSRRGRRAAR